MSGNAPRFVPRALAAAGTPAGDLLAGRGEARTLVPGLDDGAERLRALAGDAPPRLPADAFGVTGGEARRKLERILAGDGVLVSTGQQPDLLLGPLYVLYKALGAAALARALEEQHGIPALGLFWVASDDHDWDEVGRTRILDPDGEIREVRLTPPAGREGRSVGRTPVPERVGGCIDELFHYVPDTEFRPRYLELLRDAYRTGASLGEAFASTLAGLAADVPLAWLDAGAPAVREAAVPLYGRVLREREDVAGALEAGERAVVEAGYEAQLHRRSGGIPVFVDRPEGRTRLLSGPGGGIRAGSEGDERPAGAFLEELSAHPERFSPNVALRPVLESWLLPVAAAVLGPSEAAYWAELPPLFRWADVSMPAVQPRPSWTLVEGKVGKVLEKVGVAPEAFSDGGREVASAVTEEGLPPEVREALGKARGRIAEVFTSIEEAVEGELPGVRGSVGSARHGAFEALDGLESAVRDRVRERQRILLDQVEKAARNLYPAGQPQERVVSPFYFLVRYGSAFLSAAAGAATDWARQAASGVAGPEGAR